MSSLEFSVGKREMVRVFEISTWGKEMINDVLTLAYFGLTCSIGPALMILWELGLITVEDRTPPAWPSALFIVFFLLTLVVVGGVIWMVGIPCVRQVYAVECASDHSLRFLRVWGETKLFADEIVTVKKKRNSNDYQIVEIVHARGKVNVPDFAEYEELISLLKEWNPYIQLGDKES